MSLSNHPCWNTAVHEVSHIAVFLKLGGQWGSGKRISINPDYGAVGLGGLRDYEHGFFLDYCVYAAGVAADRIQGVPSYEAPGSDLYELKKLSIDLRFSAIDMELVISKVETWLRKHSWAIERAADELIKARNSNNQVAMTKSRKIIDGLRWCLPGCRRLVRRKKR